MVNRPISPFLNEFIKLDVFWGMLCQVFYFICLTFFLSFCTLKWSGSILIRFAGYCRICIFLILPTPCSDCWGHDAWFEICLYYHSSNGVIFCLTINSPIFFTHRLRNTHLVSCQNDPLGSRWAATMMSSFLFNVELILLSSIRSVYLDYWVCLLILLNSRMWCCATPMCAFRSTKRQKLIIFLKNILISSS